MKIKVIFGLEKRSLREGKKLQKKVIIFSYLVYHGKKKIISNLYTFKLFNLYLKVKNKFPFDTFLFKK